jgi:outer membrane protein OmpA-like peptidoglycan-associated protein
MKLQKIRNLSIVPVFLYLLLITGCAAVIIGVGVGVGAFSYINGQLIRTYESEYHAAINASKETLEDLKIPVNEVVGDELNTVIKAERPDGTPVAIEVERLEQNLTEISVRTGSVGVWDRKVSTQIHELIAERLARSTYTAFIANIDSKAAKAESDTTDIPAEESHNKETSEEIQEGSSPAANTQADILHTPHKDSVLIYFTHDSNDLTKEATEKLDRVAEALIENASDQIVVSGFSDSTGAASYNTMISESRANIVKVYLIGKGVKPSRITTRGLGAQKFIASNETEEGRRQNRRVEIEFIRTTAD